MFIRTSNSQTKFNTASMDALGFKCRYMQLFPLRIYKNSKTKANDKNRFATEHSDRSFELIKDGIKKTFSNNDNWL